MEWFWSFLASQPLLTLFLVISLGYAVGEITIAGFSLGVGAVLFVGLFIGAFAPKASPAAILSTVGLILFFYGIGIQYGKSFVEGLMSPSGRKQNLIALVSVIISGLVAIACIAQFKIPTQIAVGIFSGALVNTAALQSVIDKVGDKLPTVGYGVAYPFGVLGPILCIYFALNILRPTTPASKFKRVQEIEVVVSHPKVVGKTLLEIAPKMPPEVQIIAVRQDGHNRMPKKSMRIRAGDTLLLVGKSESLQQVQSWIGEETSSQMICDHTDLDDLDVYVSKSAVIGRKLGELNLADHPQCTVISLQRGDTILSPHPGLILEAGDRIWTVAERTQFETVRNFFGNSARSTSEVSYLGLGIGMVLGVLFGLIPFPLPGLGTFTFGAGGGAMIVSLILGWRGRTGNLTWIIPPSANLTLRNFGLTLFLAVVGLRSGEQFIRTLQETGFQLLGVGIAITLSVVLVAMILGYGLMRMTFDEVLGIVAGVTGNPAILAYAAKSVPTNKPELGYAIVFPTSTIIKIIVVQILLVLFEQ